jgi:alpha-amylase/alpha-mannosidase (GH57 family)
MWLPETAVDSETLDIMAEQGIRFTVLAPHQADRVRTVGNEEWQDVNGGKIDTTMPYSLNLPSGRTIALFFYNGSISRAVAFEKLLRSGVSFAQRLLGGFSQETTRAQLVHIATDGESYGHHHRFGDMALAYALDHIESKNLAQITNYGEYLEKHPPSHEVEIIENTSWSCVHGVKRWWSNCGCHTGAHPEWNQDWRAPLREALDWLRNSLGASFEEKLCWFLKDAWDARNSYIQIILDRSPANTQTFLGQHAIRELNEAERITVLKLLELQRHAMLMYTSCGWFFDELSGIETVQILQYAGRVLQLAREIFDQDLEPHFIERLAQARSNVTEFGDGRRIYEESVRPAMADLEKVGAHYAICSLFKEYERPSSFYCYTAEEEYAETRDAGKARLLTGKARFISKITNESALLSFGTLHLGDHNLTCGVKEFESEDSYQQLVADVSDAFQSADFPETIRLLDKHFGGSIYSLRSLFRDEESRILGMILGSALEDAEALYRQLYENHAPLMRFFKDSGLPPPRALKMAAEFVLNVSLRQAFENEEFDPEHIEALLKEVRVEGVTLDTATLEFAIRKKLEHMAELYSANATDLPQLQRLQMVVDLLASFPFQVNLWKVQNVCYEILQSTYPHLITEAEQGDETSREWINQFRTLGEKLSLKVA